MPLGTRPAPLSVVDQRLGSQFIGRGSVWIFLRSWMPLSHLTLN